MAEIVNLRRARKGKKRDAEGKTAQAARAKHGIARSVKKLAEAQVKKAERALSGHKLSDDP